VGWAKRGPSGLIGTNKPDAEATVTAMLEDVPSLPGATEWSPEAAIETVRARQPRFVSWDDWARLDGMEQARGKAAGKPREKLASVEEMLRELFPAG
jgi:ferredoxin--NADP+ reductase